MLDKLISILEVEYGYPISSCLSLNAVQKQKYTAFEIETSSKKVFVVGLAVNEGSRIDSLQVLKDLFLEINGCFLGFIFEDNQLTGYKFKSKDTEIVKLRDFELYRGKNRTVKPKILTKGNLECSLIDIPHNLESVFFQCHSYIRDIDGLHADEALDELCKIIYTKLYDEEHTRVDSAYRFQHYLYGNESELATSIHDLYKEANEYDKRVYSLRIPGYKRSRGVFDQLIKLSSSAILKVVQQFEQYDFSSTPLDIKGRAFQNVFLPALRAGMGQYFTPTPVIKLIINCARPTVRDLILDPFCGSGHFLTESLDFARSHEENEKAVDDFAYHKLHGIEKSERMVRVAMTDMRLHGDGHANIRCTDSLLPFENYHDIEPNSFDFVFTNPPFGSLLGKDAIDSLGEFELAKGKRKVPLEVIGLERSVQFLKIGGKLAIVLPDSILVNSSTSYVRKWLESSVVVNAVVSLPVETFSPYGANIKTSILFATKKQGTSNDKVFLGLVESVGYDASGKKKELCDVDDVISELRSHLIKEGW